jgi:hypothetical protein
VTEDPVGIEGRLVVDEGSPNGLVAELHLNPTLISKKGYAVLRADATLTDLTERPDWYRRQLPVGTG